MRSVIGGESWFLVIIIDRRRRAQCVVVILLLSCCCCCCCCYYRSNDHDNRHHSRSRSDHHTCSYVRQVNNDELAMFQVLVATTLCSLQSISQSSTRDIPTLPVTTYNNDDVSSQSHTQRSYPLWQTLNIIPVMGLPFVCVPRVCSLSLFLIAWGFTTGSVILLELVFSGQRWGGAPTSF